jgi:Cu2+-exporting ATPase
MKKTLKIEGMMCPHCEARVKNLLEALPEVTEAAVSHKKGTAVVKLTAEVSNEALAKVITDNGYKVIEVK